MYLFLTQIYHMYGVYEHACRQHSVTSDRVLINSRLDAHLASIHCILIQNGVRNDHI